MDAPKIEVNFDSDALHDLISKWVLENMTLEQRERVLQQAITYLMTPPKGDRYHQPVSPLQEAFNSNLQRVMYDIAREIVDSDPAVRESIHKVMGEALEEFLHGDSGDKKRGFDQKMGEAFAYVFNKGPYD